MPKVYCSDCKHLKYVNRMDFGGPRATPVCKATVAERETAIRKEILYTECKSINSKLYPIILPEIRKHNWRIV